VLKAGDPVDSGALLAEIGVTQANTAPTAEPQPEPAPAPAPAAAARVPSTPAARRRAEQLGISLENVVGSGPSGRIELRDLEAAKPAATAQPELSQMRRTIARAMTESAQIPQFTVSRLVCLEPYERLKAKLDAEMSGSGVTLSLNDCLLSAVAQALLTHPDVNAVFVGDPAEPGSHVRKLSGVHIGLVVSVADGILVPVLQEVDKLSLPRIATLRTDLVARARNGGLRPAELSGAAVSISNLGANGPDRFTALIHPGQSAMLAVGRRRDVAMPQHGALVVRPACELTLSADHRSIDGRGASDFLSTVAGLLENSERTWSQT